MMRCPEGIRAGKRALGLSKLMKCPKVQQRHLANNAVSTKAQSQYLSLESISLLSEHI